MLNETKRCPNCDVENGAQAKFCNGCGQPLPVEVARPTHCPGCGALLPLTGKFCNECGQKIECEPHVEKKPIHYCCSKCGNIKPTAVAFCELCGGSVQPVYAEDTTAKKAVNFAETLKGNMGKKPDVSVLFGKRKGRQNPQGKKKQWWIIVLVIVLIGGMAGGIGTAVSEGGAKNRTAQDFITAFEKAGYTMQYDADMAEEAMEDISDYANAVQMSSYYTLGTEKIKGRTVESEGGFYYIKCNTTETAAKVYDVLAGNILSEGAVVVKDSEHKEKAEYTERDFAGGEYYAMRTVVSRNGNIVVCLSVMLKDNTDLSSYTSVLFKKLEKLGF